MPTKSNKITYMSQHNPFNTKINRSSLLKIAVNQLTSNNIATKLPRNGKCKTKLPTSTHPISFYMSTPPPQKSTPNPQVSPVVVEHQS